MSDEEKEKSIEDAFSKVGEEVDKVQPTISMGDAQQIFDTLKSRDPEVANKLEQEVNAAIANGAGPGEVIGLVLGAVKGFLPFI